MTNDITILNEDIYFRKEPNSRQKGGCNDKQIYILNDDVWYFWEPNSGSDLLKLGIYNKEATRIKFLTSGKVYDVDQVSTAELDLGCSEGILFDMILEPIIYYPESYSTLEELKKMETDFINFQKNWLGIENFSEKDTEEYYNF